MNQIDLNNKVAVVTGGARGIGLAICQRFADSGAKVCIWDVDEEVAKASAANLPDASAIQVELTDPSSVASATQATLQQFGRIDILVNNAGIAGMTDKVWKIPPEDWKRVVEVDLIGPYLTSHNIVPHMLEQDSDRIVNVASIAGKEGNPNASAYSAAKAGVIALTKSLGKELADTGIRVNCITPAVIRTAIFDQMDQSHIDYMLSKIPMGRFGQVEEAAAMVAWLASEECSFSTGAVFDLSGGRATY